MNHKAGTLILVNATHMAIEYFFFLNIVYSKGKVYADCSFRLSDHNVFGEFYGKDRDVKSYLLLFHVTCYRD